MVGDINGDGLADLVVTDTVGDQIVAISLSIYLQSGSDGALTLADTGVIAGSANLTVSVDVAFRLLEL